MSSAPARPDRLPLYQVDAFADAVFQGNPAAVCPLPHWPHDTLLQAIAAENNLAETAFFVAGEASYELRWFTPRCEVELCGHATLASAFVLFECLGQGGERIDFDTRFHGRVSVSRADNLLWLDFPAAPAQPAADAPDWLAEALGAAPQNLLQGPNFMAVYADQRSVEQLTPDLGALSQLRDRGVIVTAPATALAGAPDIDFVSRYFAPNFGVDEDAVTGSAHCMLAPYWAKRLGRTRLAARQLSTRGGALRCAIHGDRVHIGGRAVLYLRGEILLEKALI